MQLQRTILFLLGLITFAHALALPASLESWAESTKELFKRKGGGGGGGRGGSGSTSSGSSGGSRSGSSSSSTSRTGSSSNDGGSTSSGSGPTRSFGSSNAFYGGGASQPYRSGNVQRGIAPYVVGGAALGIFPGLWLYGAYAYSWPGYYTWHNNTNNQNQNGTVQCWCGRYQECSCEQNNNTDYLTSVANNGSISHVADNGTLFINGTLPNGTTAPGGEGAASSLRHGLIENSGYWIVIAGVTYAVSFL